MGIVQIGNGQARYTVTMPRASHDADTSTSPPKMVPPVGFGTRSMWPLPPVGEAQRRDPHVPDPTPQGKQPLSDQAVASPPVPRVGALNAGGGVIADGMPAAVVYVKQLGRLITRSLGRELLMGVTDAQWRVGGIGYPMEAITGPGTAMGEPGYHGDSTSVDPGDAYNPQVHMRNPGIRPLVGVPASYRYAPVGNTMLYGQYQGKIAGGKPATTH